MEAAIKRERQLLSQRPNISVAHLDELGVPRFRMDFHFGAKVVPMAKPNCCSW